MDDWRRDAERERGRERPEAPAPTVEQRHESALHRLASDMGNRSFTLHVAREGDGILPDGQVHPGVERTLAETRGGGASLDAGVQERFSGTLGDLSDVRVHTDDVAHQLNRSVSARAFATGTDVYFARGEYSPGSPAGDKLLAHELTHVVQQRGAASSGPLTVSNPGDALETEADDVAERASGG